MFVDIVKKENRKFVVHGTEFAFLIGLFIRREKSIQLSD